MERFVRRGYGWWRRLRDQPAFHESELIHNLPVSIFEPEFVEHDLWFLNYQARAYCERCNPALSLLYPQQVARIRELFALEPEHLHVELRWSGPP